MEDSENVRRGTAVEPGRIEQTDDQTLLVAWADGRECFYRAADLRRLCPCAQCVNEWTGERTLRAEAIADEISIEDLQLVGRYAVTFRFTDKHETGIYSFRLLREMCERDDEQ